MKFETPKMNISMFAVENVVTTASEGTEVTEAQKVTAVYDKALSNMNPSDGADKIFRFTY